MDEDRWSQDCYLRLIRDCPKQLAIDSETTGLAWTDTAFGVSFAWYQDDRLESGYMDLRTTEPHKWESVKDWIKAEKPELIFHNAKFDMHKLNLYVQNFHDTCLMVYILNENYPKALKVLAQKILKEDTDEDTVLREARKKLGLKVSDGYDKLPLGVVAPYAIKDAEFTLRLYSRLSVALAKEEDLEEVYSLERRLLLCVAGTERRGLGVDLDYIRGRIIELGDEIITLTREIETIVGRPVGDNKKKIRVQVGKFKNGRPKFKHEKSNEFNPNSPIQILAFLQEAGVDISTTDKTSLESVDHPLAHALTRIRQISKIRNTYLVPMIEEQIDGVVHPNFNLTATKTKRFSSSGGRD